MSPKILFYFERFKAQFNLSVRTTDSDQWYGVRTNLRPLKKREEPGNEVAGGPRVIILTITSKLSHLYLQYKPSEFVSGSTLPLTRKIDWY